MLIVFFYFYNVHIIKAYYKSRCIWLVKFYARLKYKSYTLMTLTSLQIVNWLMFMYVSSLNLFRKLMKVSVFLTNELRR